MTSEAARQEAACRRRWTDHACSCYRHTWDAASNEIVHYCQHGIVKAQAFR